MLYDKVIIRVRVVRGRLLEVPWADLGQSTPGSGMGLCKDPEARKALMLEEQTEGQ